MLKSIRLCLAFGALLAFGSLTCSVSFENASLPMEQIPPIEVEPEYPGGEGEMAWFIQRNITYPKEAIANEEEGRVYIRFIVQTDGSLANFSVARGVSPFLDSEALRVCRLMPNWKPAMNKGEAVAVDVVIPIVFRLTSNKKKRK